MVDYNIFGSLFYEFSVLISFYFIKGLKYQFGGTYGDATRQLPVCNHKSENFSSYLEDNPAKTVIC